MKKHLAVLFLATAIIARAVSIVGDFAPAAPYATAETVSVAGDLRLTPGSYSAASWTVGFDVKLLAAGEYILTATAGTINIGFDIKGPATGVARLTIFGPYKLGVTGTVANNVTVVAGQTIPPPVAGIAGAAPLVNISTRATLTNGAVLNPGFVVGGTTSRRVLIRAIGPGLVGFGVQGAAISPTLAVFSGQTQIAANSGWGGGAGLAAVMSGVGAFPLATNSADAAVLLTLSPGNYTARVTGVGEVLVEIYFVD